MSLIRAMPHVDRMDGIGRSPQVTLSPRFPLPFVAGSRSR
ncbi:hypothetical protein F8B43_3683 [Methylorubrum populi]|uniref:Uncharacterized protein n=1 Tax=Methylorubrum populi TaxID=223967 RepID=A0A833J3B9_9HYPH|nr:hypothetical protein F8B43_3683 [Methylorubrum populi]